MNLENITLSEKKPQKNTDIKGQTVYDYIYMKYVE